mgnify:CR=1 FL=1
MQRDVAALESDEGKLRVASQASEKRMKQLDGKERRREVNDFFYDLMKSFIGALDVNSIDESSFKKVDATITDTGSELPRALLAYKLAFLLTARNFGTAAPAPLVIDSPNQQDQDEVHLDRILSFVRDRRPPQQQLIVGLVDTADIDLGGKTIELKRKYSLLDEGEFENVAAEVQSYIDLALERS